MNTETAEHQKDLDELCRAKNARDEATKQLTIERAAHTALKQLIRESLGREGQEGQPESVIVMEAAAALRQRAQTENALPIPLAKPVRDGEDPGDPEEPDDRNRPLSFRDHAFLQSLAGVAAEIAQANEEHSTLEELSAPVVAAAKEIAKQADERHDW